MTRTFEQTGVDVVESHSVAGEAPAEGDFVGVCAVFIARTSRDRGRAADAADGREGIEGGFDFGISGIPGD
jgi:hypothetical protein